MSAKKYSLRLEGCQPGLGWELLPHEITIGSKTVVIHVLVVLLYQYLACYGCEQTP